MDWELILKIHVTALFVMFFGGYAEIFFCKKDYGIRYLAAVIWTFSFVLFALIFMWTH